MYLVGVELAEFFLQHRLILTLCERNKRFFPNIRDAARRACDELYVMCGRWHIEIEREFDRDAPWVNDDRPIVRASSRPFSAIRWASLSWPIKYFSWDGSECVGVG